MKTTRDLQGRRLWLMGRMPEDAPAPPPPGADLADWRQATPPRIDGWLQRALALPCGGWFAAAAAAGVGRQPFAVRIDGQDLVLWRDARGTLHAAPDRCPHFGARWSGAGAADSAGRLLCPWHGLQLDPARPCVPLLPTFDDGLLVWVRLPGEMPTARPALPERPQSGIAAVHVVHGRCEPREVLENRLDPWHGAHYHRHSFARLRWVAEDDTGLTVRVAFRAFGPLAVEVDARFHCVDARCIVMTIVGGEGRGSVVETHATPVGPGRTAVIEAVAAQSGRAGFRLLAGLAPLLRGLLRRSARRLWMEDIAYCERRYALRVEQAAAAPRSGVAPVTQNPVSQPRRAPEDG